MDFIFEVDDTGKRIPKENYKCVFENYVQIQDTALGQAEQAWDSGLCSRWYVRLMHEDIEIVEKDTGERGTCFKFNVVLSVCENEAVSSPKPEASLVVLLIVDEERQRTSQRFMERLGGIKVKVLNTGKGLFYTLRKIKLKAKYSSGQNYPVFKKTNMGASPGFILVVIDANAGPFSELYPIVSNFNMCLDKPFVGRINLKALNQDDIVTSKPFHGTRLFQTIKLLPEFGGSWQCNSGRAKREMANERTTSNTYKDPGENNSCSSWRNTRCWKLIRVSQTLEG
ncbi:Histidine kinase [Vigna angularis]|uniref:histidine kinase n=1 Tax=Phaseolus angularis TaxID=3914 RepID=A0A8T0JVQ6_PHAAN|nr:Histidine kinase [Vigna angularis]